MEQGQAPTEQTPAEPAAETQTQTTHPVPAADAAAGANTAPAPKELQREAFDRLSRGESPETVNRTLYQDKPAQAGKPGDAPPVRTDANAQRQAPAADPAAGEPTVQPEDLQVLKRAKFDMSAWNHIPPSNRRAIINTLKNSQAEADRQFQRARSGTAPEGAQPTQPNTPSQTQTDAQDGATRGEGQPGDLQPDPAQQRQQPRQQPAASEQQPASPFLQPIDPNTLIDPKDLETLRGLGGDELAEQHRKGIARAVGLVQQQFAPLAGMVTHLMGHWEQSEFNGAVDALKKQPGFDQLTTDQVGQLREKANLLIRAAGDVNYRHEQAVPDAAASLFRTNVQQAAQKALMERRSQSLRGSPERGVGKLPEARAMNPKERMSAIFDRLREGLSPEAARAAVDGR